jgi:Sulfotransferase family
MNLFENLFLSIGAMKSGSSWLAKQLEDHPDIYLTPLKEIHYFAHLHSPVKVLDENGRREAMKFYFTWVNADLANEILISNLKWFEQYLESPLNDAWFYNLFRNRRGKKYCAEFSNLLAICNDDVWPHIDSLCENARVLYTIRDPLMRLWSHTRFQAQLSGVFDRMPEWGETEYSNFIHSGDILRHSAYSDTISKLRRNLEPYQFIVLYFEDFRDNPLKELRRLERFLAIPSKVYGNLDFHNPSLPQEMPEPFLLACQDPLSAEFEKLDQLGVKIPGSWTLPERNSRGPAFAPVNAKATLWGAKPARKPAPERTRIANAQKSKLRPATEHVFACQKGLIRTMGLGRAQVKIGFANLAYNMRRFVWLWADARPDEHRGAQAIQSLQAAPRQSGPESPASSRQDERAPSAAKRFTAEAISRLGRWRGASAKFIVQHIENEC